MNFLSTRCGLGGAATCVFGCNDGVLLSDLYISLSSNNSLISPLINPESVLGIGGKIGLDGACGLERAEAVRRSTGGEELISGGVSTGLSSFSGEVIADSIDKRT